MMFGHFKGHYFFKKNKRYQQSPAVSSRCVMVTYNFVPTCIVGFEFVFFTCNIFLGGA